MEPTRSTVELPWGPVSYLTWMPPTPSVPDARPTPDKPSTPTDRTTVVLLHGGALDSAELSWGGLGPALATAGWRVIAPDHPGWGHSPPADRPATQEALLSYLSAFLTRLGLEVPVLGGISLGGGLALGHVVNGGHGVRALLLFGSYGLWDRQFTGRLSRPLHTLTWALLHTGVLDRIMRLYGDHPRLLASSLSGAMRDRSARTPELVAAVQAEYDRGSGLRAFSQWQRDQFLRDRLRTTYLDRLSEISVPTLVVHGERDAGVPAAAAVDAAGRLPHGSLLLVPNAGHWVQRDRPDHVVPAVLEFLDSVDAPRD